MKTIVYYTILIHSQMTEIKTFSIVFSKDNTPKDIWDHHDAVTDYLVDFTLNAFESIPDFTILRTFIEQ